jgi:hypothetical protein
LLDHYTLIVENAKAVARFHTEVLGFKHLRIQKVNAGSVPEGQHDMLNYVLQLPDSNKRVMVVTEGLTEESIFCRYLNTYGSGVHHIAYAVEDLDLIFDQLWENKIKTTSDQILRDPLSGLRQVFISREHSGYFIELIERTETSQAGVFTHDNMSALAKTMTSYLNSPASNPGPPPSLHVVIKVPQQDVLEYLCDPSKLAQWTGHRTVRCIDGQWCEVRMVGDIPLSIISSETGCTFTWSLGQEKLSIHFSVIAQTKRSTEVKVAMPPLTGARLTRTL